MKLMEIESREKGRFINRYDLHYDCGKGDELIYEIVSRDPALDTFEKLSDSIADAVLVVGFDQEGEHMLVNREFRPETGRIVFGLPGGLREDGESPEECAAREVMEETGLKVEQIFEILPPAYCTVGIGNEMTVIIFASLSGDISRVNDGHEQISPVWMSREEVRTAMREERFGSWCLAFAWMWANGRLTF